jgi:hypothetical protein
MSRCTNRVGHDSRSKQESRASGAGSRLCYGV